MTSKLEHPLSICCWPDNTQCFRFELEDMNHMSDENADFRRSGSDFIVVEYGSLYYPDNITIHEVDYDKVINTRRVLLGISKGD